MSAEPMPRFMEEKDLPTTAYLFEELYQHLNKLGFVFELNKAFLPEYLRLQLSSRMGCIIVLELEGAVIGCIGISAPLLNRKYLLQNSKLTGYISELYMLEKYRGKGYAKLLLAAGEQFLREAGANVIQVNAVSQNTPAIEFYKKHGFREDYMGLIKQH